MNIRYYLMPLAWIYGLLVWLRNLLYDYSILRSRKYNLPVICVGNVAAGGTGKTPHTEYLIRLLGAGKGIATLSRGYGRLSRGFVLAGIEHTSHDIGDEPRQFRQKFSNISVAVDENRRRGIMQLMELNRELEIVLLDDAFQHRAVQAGFSIVVTDYHRLYSGDVLLPAGYLRESRRGVERADVIIVSKCPAVLSPIERRMLTDDLKPQPHQHLFFTYLHYSSPVCLNLAFRDAFEKPTSALLFTGIANPYPLEDFLKRKLVYLETLHFPDHYEFKEKDIRRIREIFASIVGKNKVIYTTEKDIMRLDKPGLRELIDDLPVFYVPVEVVFHGDDKEEFDKLILDYVRENKRNR